MNHDMMTMSMASSTSSAPMSTGTSSMGDMDMGGMHGGMSSCKISMLWNWNTIDACFLAESWHITSRSMFAGSCIGVICLVICLEFLRRVGREYDAFIMRRARLRALYLRPSPTTTTRTEAGGEGEGEASGSSSPKQAAQCIAPASASTPVSEIPVRPRLSEQAVRALLHMLQFAVAYFVMLLAMYFNGYIIICIFIGAYIGAFIFSWETLGGGRENDATAVTKCCG